MAMPPGNVNVTPVEKLQFPPPGAWIPDGRDGFISWLRGEFAAANAIINSLCHHLQTIGDSNEYESVISSIYHRQLAWSQVLYMQQFIPPTEVSYNLQQVAWKKQQQQQQVATPQRHYSSDQSGRFGGRRGNGFNKHHHNGGGYRGAESMARNGHSSSLDCSEKRVAVGEEKRDGNEKPKSDSKGSEEFVSAGGETVSLNCNSASKDNSISSEVKQDEKDKECKTFVVQEMYEAKMVNVVEGLKLYNKTLDVKEVSNLVSLVNNLRLSGRRGQLQSDAYLGYKRPNRGRGRETIQLGLPIADTQPDDESIKDRRIEPIPSLLSDIIERLVSKKIIPVKPDACIIDFFTEGDHSMPHMFVPWFGRPVSILSLSECDFTFGRVIVSDLLGDYKGSLKLSLSPGSVLRVEGKSADLAKFAIPAVPKQRILITFVKSQPRNYLPGPNSGPPPSRTPDHHIRHPNGPPKHYPVIQTTGVLPTPSLRPPNGAVQPIFIAASPPLAPPMPFPGGVPPSPTVWPLPPHPRHQPPPQPRMPIPGTGVFLPPGSTHEPVLHGSPKKYGNSYRSNTAEGKIVMKTKEEVSNGTAAEERDDGNGSGDGKQSN